MDNEAKQIEELMNTIQELEDAFRTGLKLTERQKNTLEEARVMLSELQNETKKEVDRLMKESREADEGIFPEK